MHCIKSWPGFNFNGSTTHQTIKELQKNIIHFPSFYSQLDNVWRRLNKIISIFQHNFLMYLISWFSKKKKKKKKKKIIIFHPDAKSSLSISFNSSKISQIDNQGKTLCCRMNMTHFCDAAGWMCGVYQEVSRSQDMSRDSVCVSLVSCLGLGTHCLGLGLGWFWKQLSLSRSLMSRSRSWLKLSWTQHWYIPTNF